MPDVFDALRDYVDARFSEVDAKIAALTPKPALLTGAFTGGFDPAGADAFQTLLGRETYAVEFSGDASATDYNTWAMTQWPASRKLLYTQSLLYHGGPTLAQAAAGALDAQWHAIGAALAQHPNVFAVRLGHECNGGWYPWTIQGGNEAAYAAAFRRCALILRDHVPGLKLDWNVNWQQPDPTAAYPGDDVVDYVTMDLYEDSQWTPGAPAVRWAGFLDPWNHIGLNWLATFAATHGKMIGIPEYGSNYDDGELVTRMAAWIKARPTVAYHSWWDSASSFNSVFDTHPTNKAAFLAAWR